MIITSLIHLAPYECWINNNWKFFTLKKSFLRPSVFDLHTEDSNPIFQSVHEKSAHHETNEHFWDNLPPNFKKSSVFNIESLLL